MKDFYGVEAASEASSHVAHIVELVGIRGYAELPGLLSPQQVQDYSARLDTVYDRQVEELGRDNLRAIGEENLARCPLAYDEAFVDLLADLRVLEVVRALLGNYVVLHLQNGIIVHPHTQHHQSAWHRDLPYQEFVSSRPLAANVFICLEDFSFETGGTMFLAFSHRQEKLPSKGVLESLQEQPRVRAGSAVVFDSMVFHRAGNNVSGRIRRGINQVFTTGIVRQQIDIPGWLPAQNPDLHERALKDPELATILGYDARTADSVLAFRRRRQANAGSKPT